MVGARADVERPRLRDSVIVQQDGNELLFILTANRTVKRFAVTDTVVRLLPLLDGRRTVPELVGLLASAGNGPDGAQLRSLLALMARENLLSATPDPAASFQRLGPEQAAHYDRQLRLLDDFCDQGLAASADEDGVALQQRLGRATVLVCGIGGVGGWVAQSLAASGVGTLRLCDYDRVEVSNLTRQVLFSTEDIGRSKVTAAAGRLMAVNPQVRVEAVDRRIGQAADLRDLVDGCDLLVSCADQPDVTSFCEWVADACHPQTPYLVGGSYSYHIGILGLTVLPGRSACWECARVETRQDHHRDRADLIIPKPPRAGATGALAGLVGNALAWEALRVLMGLPPAFTDSWGEIDYWPMRIHRRPIPRRPQCSRCGSPDHGHRA